MLSMRVAAKDKNGAANGAASVADAEEGSFGLRMASVGKLYQMAPATATAFEPLAKELKALGFIRYKDLSAGFVLFMTPSLGPSGDVGAVQYRAPGVLTDPAEGRAGFVMVVPPKLISGGHLHVAGVQDLPE